jgi:putative NADH-flavin reductase
MKVVIFGAGGLTGRALVSQAIANDHLVTAFVRRPERFTVSHSRLRVVAGDVTEISAVEAALSEQDAAISALGNATPFRRFPMLVEGIGNIVRMMEQRGPRRLIYLSFATGDGGRQLSRVARLIVPLLLRNELADHAAKEVIIRQSTLDWTIVRPTKMTNGRATGVYRRGGSIEPNSLLPLISRADVAEFMLAQLTDTTYGVQSR